MKFNLVADYKARINPQGSPTHPDSKNVIWAGYYLKKKIRPLVYQSGFQRLKTDCNSPPDIPCDSQSVLYKEQREEVVL